MGCDIHAHIEYQFEMVIDPSEYLPKEVAEKMSIKREVVKKHWGAVGLDRNYGFFALMAGVRTYGNTTFELFAAKGLPEDTTYGTLAGYADYVIEDEEWSDFYENSGEYQKKSDALKYIEEYGCKAWYDPDGRLWRVQNPDWHSSSWLTAEELEKVFARYSEIAEENKWPRFDREIPYSYQGTLALMKALPNSRLVFWFDN